MPKFRTRFHRKTIREMLSLAASDICASVDPDWARTELAHPGTKLAFITCWAGEVKLEMVLRKP